MSYLEIKEENHQVHLSLNNPSKRNAFNAEMISELKEFFVKMKTSSARVIYLSGAGESFCAGADLDWMKSMADFTEEENIKDSEELFNMFYEAYTCPIPIVGKVHGHAMGGALGLVAICDVCYAAEGTKFAFSEVKLGLAPAVISPFVLTKMNQGMANELMVSGRVFSAEEAAKAGLVSQVGSDSEISEKVNKSLAGFLKAGPQAVSATKELFRSQVNDPQKVKKQVTELIAKRRVSEEGQEGLSSFFEKRKASWSLDG